MDNEMVQLLQNKNLNKSLNSLLKKKKKLNELKKQFFISYESVMNELIDLDKINQFSLNNENISIQEDINIINISENNEGYNDNNFLENEKNNSEKRNDELNDELNHDLNNELNDEIIDNNTNLMINKDKKKIDIDLIFNNIIQEEEKKILDKYKLDEINYFINLTSLFEWATKSKELFKILINNENES